MEARRSYLLAFTGLGLEGATGGMYLSAGSSTRSVRDVPTATGQPLVLVGGAGHPVGRTRSTRAHLDELRDWTRGWAPDAVETHAWSAQDYTSYDGLPLVGALPFGRGDVLYATGYDKWGMTNAVAAGLTLSTTILGEEQPGWATTLASRPMTVGGLARAAVLGAKVAVAGTTALLDAERAGRPDPGDDGQGAVGQELGLPVGAATVEGHTCKVVALCSHLGGTLRWNEVQGSWDCPLHGSRFTADGAVLEGPATTPLQRRDSGEAGPPPA